MLRYSLKSLDKLDTFKEQEKLTSNLPPILATSSLALIDYSSYSLNLSLILALIAFDPADPYQSGVNLFSTLDSSRIS